MNMLVIAPILVPLVTVAFLLLLGSNERHSKWLSLIGASGSLVASSALWFAVWRGSILVHSIGSWPSPFGIVFVADLLAVSMVLIAAFVGFCTALYLLDSNGSRRGTREQGYFVVFQTLLMAVNGSFLSGDLFNLYVWFELMLMSSFVLMVYERRRAQIEGTLKYTVLNLIASFMFLSAIALIYSVAGTLNMADLAQKLATPDQPLVVQSAFALLLIAFGTKAGVFPLFNWLPASYHTPGPATSALFAGLLTKVGVYALVRIVTLIFPSDLSSIQPMLVVIANLTMITGVLGAVSFFDIRRILAFHIISQIGYMILGLALFTPAALAATYYYIVHVIIAKTNLFFISGIIERKTGTSELKKIGGIYREAPVLGFLFLISALSLAGLPPLSGFFAKFSLLKASVELNRFATLAVALGVGLLTLVSMMKIWMEAFWKPHNSCAHETANDSKMYASLPMIAPVVIMAATTLLFGVWPQVLFGPAQRVAEELLNRTVYINAVLDRG